MALILENLPKTIENDAFLFVLDHCNVYFQEMATSLHHSLLFASLYCFLFLGLLIQMQDNRYRLI
jgi:hypothetical protein